uniref:NADH dehydrogenase subunit 2 n=1 Tax=Succinea arundinetorum TaxID=2981998 RepID=UPI00226CC722|nr:NADH dehydrogenase subunit 2 [Succinea arundinetorum]UZH97777.1 NADH dehydrogenase subunit 2 [Succinea arundinetorum]
MFLKFFLNFNLLMMIFLPMLSLTSSDWFLSWFYMEMMLMFFYSLFFKLNWDILSNFSSMKYFIIQSLASMLLLVTGLGVFFHSDLNLLLNFIFFLSLLIKLGVYPFHFWVIPILKNLNLLMTFLLLYLMKIIPLSFMNLILYEFYQDKLMLMMVVFLSFMTMFMGSLMGNNFLSFNSMLGSSSINHSGWFLLSMIGGLFWYYFMMYGLIFSFLLVSMFSLNGLTTFFSLIGMSGLPPFAVFFAKLKVLSFLIYNNYLFFLIMIIVLSVFSLMYYLKFSFYYYLVEKNLFFNFNWLFMSFLMFNSLTLFLLFF